MAKVRAILGEKLKQYPSRAKIVVYYRKVKEVKELAAYFGCDCYHSDRIRRYCGSERTESWVRLGVVKKSLGVALHQWCLAAV